jgi:hypothetical protein
MITRYIIGLIGAAAAIAALAAQNGPHTRSR